MPKYPQLACEINDVAATGMISIHDLPWVCRTIGLCVRLTVDEGTFEKIKENGRDDVDKDALYGCEMGPVRAHLLFRWIDNGSQRLVGHYDILYPRKGPVAILLKQDAPRPNLFSLGEGLEFVIYIYIYMYMYIDDFQSICLSL